MKKKILLPLLPLFLSSCFSTTYKKDQQLIVEEIPVEHDYSELEDYRIEWEDIFNISMDDYFVFFFSINCSHCENIKNEIVEIILSRNDVFVVKGSNKVVFKNEIFSTIGAVNVGDFGILGYPSCVEIKDGKVAKNVAGKSQILNILT